MNPEAKLAELGLTLPNPPAAAGSYVPTVRTGNLLYCAGTICMVNGQMTHVGQVGKEQTVATAAKAAEVIAMFEPGIVIPMHYKVDGTMLKLNPLKQFLQEMGLNKEKAETSLKVTSSSVPSETKVVVLEAAS